MNHVYIDGNILSSQYTVLRFTRGEKFSVDIDSNLKIPVITYIEGVSRWNEVPYVTQSTEDFISYEGDLHLLPLHTLNGLTLYLYPERETYLFSVFIDAQHTEPEYGESEVGGYLIVPMNFNGTDREIEEVINSSSTFFHVIASDFRPANILGVDLKERKVKTQWENTIPYGDYPRLYLNEAQIVAAFIKTMKSTYPEIEFFPQSSERRNLGKETCFYRTRLVSDRSLRFNSNVMCNAADGRWNQTTIPLEMHYQTSDIAQYSHRRSQYLLSHFFMDVHDFTFKVRRSYPDRWGRYEEEFTFSTYWDREVVDDMLKVDSPDGSGRDTYVLTILCDLICNIIERSEEVVPIREVITNLYFSGEKSNDRT